MKRGSLRLYTCYPRAGPSHLTVAENLRVASAPPEREMTTILDEALTLFPILAQRREHAGMLERR